MFAKSDRVSLINLYIYKSQDLEVDSINSEYLQHRLNNHQIKRRSIRNKNNLFLTSVHKINLD